MRQKMLDKQYKLITRELRHRQEADALQAVIEELRQMYFRHLRDANELKKERDQVERKLCPVKELPCKNERKKRTTVQVDLNEEQLKQVAARLGLDWERLKEGL